MEAACNASVCDRYPCMFRYSYRRRHSRDQLKIYSLTNQSHCLFASAPEDKRISALESYDRPVTFCCSDQKPIYLFLLHAVAAHSLADIYQQAIIPCIIQQTVVNKTVVKDGICHSYEFAAPHCDQILVSGACSDDVHFTHLAPPASLKQPQPLCSRYYRPCPLHIHAQYFRRHVS